MDTDVLFAELTNFVAQLLDLESELTREGEAISVTPLQYKLLQNLYFSGSSNLSTLSDCLAISPPNCSREVKKLSLQGLVRKQPDLDDRRVTTLALSEEGRLLVEGVLRSMKQKFFARGLAWDESTVEQTRTAIRTLQRTLFKS